MGHDRKYGKVTTEFGDIGEDEPVVVFRAKDKFLPLVLSHYIVECSKHADVPHRHIKIVRNTLDTIKEWQKANGCRTPTSESSRDRLPE